MKIKFYTVSLLLALSLSASATLSFTSSGPFNNNGGAGAGIIPDNSIIGLSDSHTFSGELTSITAVILSVTLQGGFGTDLTGYLRMGNQTSSPYYDLTTTLHELTLSANTPTTFTVDSSTLSTYFNSQDPNTTWTLFFADNSPGGQSTLNGWSLDITAVPEPVNIAMVIFGVMLVGVGVARWYLRARQQISI
jgi:hypothetical protein